jgi:hypothetical protein
MDTKQALALVLTKPDGGTFRGVQLGMSRAAVVEAEGKKGFDKASKADQATWYRSLDDGSFEQIAAQFEADSLTELRYTLHLEGVAGAAAAQAIAKEAVERMAERFGRGRDRG